MTGLAWAAVYGYPQAPAADTLRGRRRRAMSRLYGKNRESLTIYRSLKDGTSKMGRYSSIPKDYDPRTRDQSLHPALQDLGDMIVYDLQQACDALDDPDLWYPGVDSGIDPVPDSHVELVIWATQRELRRELRQKNGTIRPAVELTELPWRIQRAFVERRRLRYQEWGITRERWKRGVWRAIDIPADDWWPPWLEGG